MKLFWWTYLYYLSKFNTHSREITDFPCMLLCYISLLSHAATFFFSLSICFPSTVSAAESKMVRAALVTATSLALTGAVVAHAYLLKHQFYPTVVYLTKSSPSMAVRTVPKWSQILSVVLNNLYILPILISHNLSISSKKSAFAFWFWFQVLYIQAFVLVFLLGKFMRKVFFGQLRAAEMEVEFCLCLWLTWLILTHI